MAGNCWEESGFPSVSQNPPSALPESSQIYNTAGQTKNLAFVSARGYGVCTIRKCTKGGVTLARGFSVFLFCTAAAARLLNFKSATFFEFLFFTLVPVGNRTKIAANSRINFSLFTANRHSNLLKKWEKFNSSNAATLCEAEPEFDLRNVRRSFRSVGFRSKHVNSIPQYSALSTRIITISSIFLEIFSENSD